ncbi:MAG: molybdate ABC transporter substrate-binding protein [Pirellulaceae bacterium]
MLPHSTRRARFGRVNLVWVLLGGGALAVVGLLLILNTGGSDSNDSSKPLVMYCAAGLRVPVEMAAREYEKEYGTPIDLQFGGSNTLLSQIDVNQASDADLYLAADDAYTDLAHEKGLSDETLPIAHMRPVIAVRKDSTKKITSLADLMQADIRVALAHPDQAAVGKATRSRLQKYAAGDTNLWQQLEQHVTKNGVFKSTVNDVATDVKIGSVDAGIVWDSTVAMPDYAGELEAVHVPELDGDPNLVSITVLKTTKRPTEALRFARYLTARDKGLPLFEKFGLRPIDGDMWEANPQVTFFCGAVNKRAVEQIVADFESREGVKVNTVYNGCGTLTSTMKGIAGQDPKNGFPDVYMACDIYYLENVKDWFQEAANVSDCEIVIAVPKGSTKVKSLNDLIEPGVRVAIGQPEQCTIGALTRRLLEKEQLYDKLMAKQKQSDEVVVEKPSSALLVPDVVAGHVDAALAYITDTLANKDTIDVVKIESSLNRAVQPFSIAKTSDHKFLLRRLFKRITDSPEAFESAGFNFRLNKKPQEQDEQVADKPEGSQP